MIQRTVWRLRMIYCARTGGTAKSASWKSVARAPTFPHFLTNTKSPALGVQGSKTKLCTATGARIAADISAHGGNVPSSWVAASDLKLVPLGANQSIAWHGPPVTAVSVSIISPADARIYDFGIPPLKSSASSTQRLARSMIEMDPSLMQRAQALINRLHNGHDEKYGFGSMSCAIYDSAWVSQISKVEGGVRKWLFPQCFLYILANQKQDGSWESYSSEIDGILNTAASLLALHRHFFDPLQISHITSGDLLRRFNAGKIALQKMLTDWDVESTEHVGFEILVPALLKYLEDAGHCFPFPRKDLLMKIRAEKLRKFKPEYLYGKAKLTPLHSLEAFIGTIDFDRLSHQKTFGSMMASPSSTAAYLMNVSKWDEDSEHYLRHVVAAGPGWGNGGVPSAYPSTHFEYSWVLSTLLKAGFSKASLGSEQTESLLNVLATAFDHENGNIGFAPFVGSDADDTAKTIMAMNSLGKPTQPQALIQAYESKEYFITYPGERTPSFSVNCNVLDALLHSPNPSDFIAQIEKAARYLCKRWYESNDPIMDKWNISTSYSTMLMSQSLMKLLEMWDKEILPGLNGDLIHDELPLVLFQALSRTLQRQRASGFWGKTDSPEETAYSLLAIAALSSLPFIRPLDEDIQNAIHKGRAALESLTGAVSTAEYLWIEKVTYSSPILCETYILAALHATAQLEKHVFRHQPTEVMNMKKVNKFLPFYQKLLTIGALPAWRIRISLMEGCLFTPFLSKVRYQVFPARSTDNFEEKYWDNIRFTWCCVNSIDLTFASADFIVQWMTISYLNYQGDEYMEAIVGTRFSHNWEAVRAVIEDVFKPEASWADLKASNGAKRNGTLTNGHNGNSVVGNGAADHATTNGEVATNGVINGTTHDAVNNGEVSTNGVVNGITHETSKTEEASIYDAMNRTTHDAVNNGDPPPNGVMSGTTYEAPETEEVVTNNVMNGTTTHNAANNENAVIDSVMNGVSSNGHAIGFEAKDNTITKNRTISNDFESETAINGATINNNATINGTTSGKSLKRVDSKLDMEATNGATSDDLDLQEIRRVLTLLNDWTFTHPQVLKASPYQLKETKHEMKMWFLGHLIQAEDSVRLARQKTYMPFETPTSNFYNWVTHVSADHTSAPYAYELLLCLISDGSGNDTFPTAEQKYYSAAANRHLSTLCRMENDYGSATRDRIERNLNFIDFPEFFDQGGTCFTSTFKAEEATPMEAEQKAQLLRLAQYERESYRDALRRLDELVAGDKKAMRKMQLLRVMTNVTDSWGQMYVFRDLGRAIETIVQANDQQLKGQWSVPAKTY